MSVHHKWCEEMLLSFYQKCSRPQNSFNSPFRALATKVAKEKKLRKKFVKKLVTVKAKKPKIVRSPSTDETPKSVAKVAEKSQSIVKSEATPKALNRFQQRGMTAN